MNNTENVETTPVVTHITEVKLSLEPDQCILNDAVSAKVLVTPMMVREAGSKIATHYARVASMMEFLSGHGFSFSCKGKSVCCFSSKVEAGEIKKLLTGAGFKDREFQIVLEYTRGWGIL